ncbi:MAG: hypothetical protein JJT99_08185 [Rhodobacteraceae bacterium]|nr:hypothetical protein [Paracoccaceae bacterium]
MEAAAQKQIDPKPDLTLTKDPAAIWPDALDCPDFPLQSRGAEFKPAWARADAEKRLRALSGILNGNGPLRAPTDAERAEALERHFKPRMAAIRGLREVTFETRGFPGLVGAIGTNHGDLIAEATHLRGYLRKLAVQAEQAAADAQARAERRARATLDDYRATIEAKKAEAEALADGAARYRQWLDDQRAYERLQAMPRDLEGLHQGAVAAAQELGEAAPKAPDWIETLCKPA